MAIAEKKRRLKADTALPKPRAPTRGGRAKRPNGRGAKTGGGCQGEGGPLAAHGEAGTGTREAGREPKASAEREAREDTPAKVTTAAGGDPQRHDDRDDRDDRERASEASTNTVEETAA